MMKCSKCDGYIPDIIIGKDRNNCKNHIQPEINLTHSFKRTYFDKDGKRYYT